MKTARINTVSRAKQQQSVGKKYGRLLVQEIVYEKRYKKSTVAFAKGVCDCGERYFGRLVDLKAARVKSCGCLNRELITKHGFAKEKNNPLLYMHQAWCSMRQRCYNKKSKYYKNYGGRGIDVSVSWRESFDIFFSDMGLRPTPKHSIDRKDNNAGYSKENCHWATSKQQRQNSRQNVYVTFGYATRCLSYWCELFGVPHATASGRVRRRGITYQQALTRPKRIFKKLNNETLHVQNLS